MSAPHVDRMGHSGAGISWHIHFNSGGVGVYQLLNSLGGFTSMCPVLLASCPEGGGGIQEGVIADGLDQAVAQGSWWFGIPGCRISALLSFKPFPRNGDVSCCGYFHSRGGHLHNKKKLNTASAEQAESVPLVHVGMLEHGNIRESCSETLSGIIWGHRFYFSR